jgi:hypothetical protein
MVHNVTNMQIILNDLFARRIYRKGANRRIKLDIFKVIFSGILVYKANENPSLAPAMRKLRRVYDDYLPFWILLYPVSLIPNSFFVMIKRIKDNI